ncbi:MAG: PspC domain-containing protein, partial [Acidimicrobiia bacterium]|nr:PspC domain-containing protein [Acidimicrobiia bacterium]
PPPGPTPPSGATPPPPPPPGRSWWHTPLQRPKEGREVGGVVRGLANAYGFDVKPWRVALVVGSVMFPPLLAAYLIAWMAVPEEPSPARSPAQISRTASGAWVAVAALALFAWFVIDDGPGDGGLVVAAILGAAGVLLWRSGPDTEGAGGTAQAASAPGTSPQGDATTSLAEPSTWAGPARWGPHPGGDAARPAGTSTTSLVPAAGGDLDVHGEDALTGPATVSPPWASPPPWSDTEPLAAPRRSRPPITGITLALIPGMLGVALGGDALGWWSMSVANALALVLVVVGVGMLVGAAAGAGRGLGLVALALTPAVVLASTFPDVSLRGAWGDRLLTPATVAEASAGFDHGVGKLTVDLQELPADADATVPVELGIGELVILVPDDVDLVVDAEMGAGELVVGDRRASGARLDELWTESGGPRAEAEVRLELETGVGKIEVQRLARPEELPR